MLLKAQRVSFNGIHTSLGICFSHRFAQRLKYSKERKDKLLYIEAKFTLLEKNTEHLIKATHADLKKGGKE